MGAHYVEEVDEPVNEGDVSFSNGEGSQANDLNFPDLDQSDSFESFEDDTWGPYR